MKDSLLVSEQVATQLWRGMTAEEKGAISKDYVLPAEYTGFVEIFFSRKLRQGSLGTVRAAELSKSCPNDI